jgi:SET domain-containing protein
MTSTSSILEVKKSTIHGKGVFSLKQFSPNDFIAEFTGEIVFKDSTHVLWIHKKDQKPYGIQGTAPLKYLNHSRGPNCEFRAECLYAIREIKIGDELCFHYGEEWSDVP